jgi:hypothetical protein
MPLHACRISQALATAICNLVVDAVDAGTPPGAIILYKGTMPATCNTALGTAVEVATCVLNTTAYGAATFGTTSANAELTQTPVVGAKCVSATGNAAAVTFFRLCNAAGTAILQGTCSATAGDDLVLNAAIIAPDSEVNITSLVVSVPVNQA